MTLYKRYGKCLLFYHKIVIISVEIDVKKNSVKNLGQIKLDPASFIPFSRIPFLYG